MLDLNYVDRRVYSVFSALKLDPDSWQVRQDKNGIVVWNEIFEIREEQEINRFQTYVHGVEMGELHTNFDSALVWTAGKAALLNAREVATRVLQTCDQADLDSQSDDLTLDVEIEDYNGRD